MGNDSWKRESTLRKCEKIEVLMQVSEFIVASKLNSTFLRFNVPTP
jgi:hypothetical protein